MRSKEDTTTRGLPFEDDLILNISPLAKRIRPAYLDDIAGQEHLLGRKGLIRNMVETGNIRSMILWGPPGTGKTTIAYVLANTVKCNYLELNAISSGVRELRESIERAEKSSLSGQKTILFVDEIHRFNKAQQAALLKSVEDGTIILIGATTENPSFEVITPLLSRCHVLILYPLGDNELDVIINRALKSDVKLSDLSLQDSARDELKKMCGGDARVMLNALETAFDLSVTGHREVVDLKAVREAYQTQHFRYDRSGDEHYNTISAFIKSVRGSDPDASVYYLARMLEAGEDPKFIARRLIILASEDIGNAEPYALTLATDCFTAVNYIGMPEARIVLSQAVTFLASCPKSNASYIAIDRAIQDVKKNTGIEIPMHLRNAPTKMMKQMGYGSGYKYSHKNKNGFVEQDFLPSKLLDRTYYEPKDIGKESRLKKYLEAVWKKRKK